MRDRYSLQAQQIIGKRSLTKGDVILTSDPFAYAISNAVRGQYCDHCISSNRTKPLVCCKQCSFLWYCDDMCMFEGRKVHQYECLALKRMSPKAPSNFVRLVARVMLRLRNGADNFIEYYTESKGRKFKDLMNHYRDIKGCDDRMKDVRNVMEELAEFLGSDFLPNESDFIGIYGRVLVNRFCLMDEMNVGIGTAVYLSGSIFDHSCKPNAYPSFFNNKLIIRTLVDVPQLDYNKVFISYIDVAMTTKQRQDELKNNWFFICQCSLCASDGIKKYENCIQCENPLCEELLTVPEKRDSQFSQTPSKPIECPACRCALHPETISQYQSVVSFTRHRLKSLQDDNPSIETCLAVLEKQADLLPPLNVWRVRALDYAQNGVSHRGIWTKALEYGNQNLEGMKLYYGEGHPNMGQFYLKMSRASMYLKMHRDGLKYGQMAESILKKALGPEHKLISEVIHGLMTIANEDLEILLERRLQAQQEVEHEKMCKHCGRKKGTMPKAENQDKQMLVTVHAANAVNEQIMEHPQNNDAVLIPTFRPNGSTQALLSDRVLEYLKSLEIY